MLSWIALAAVSAGLAAFMANRLWVLFTRNKITVKGITYSREDSPIGFWFWVFAAVFGLLAGLAVVTLAAAGLVMGVP